VTGVQTCALPISTTQAIIPLPTSKQPTALYGPILPSLLKGTEPI